MRSLNKNSSGLIFSDTIVVSEKFVSSCADLFSATMQQRAEKVGVLLVKMQSIYVECWTIVYMTFCLLLPSLCISSEIQFGKKSKNDEKVCMYNQCNLMYIQLHSGNTVPLTV